MVGATCQHGIFLHWTLPLRLFARSILNVCTNHDQIPLRLVVGATAVLRMARQRRREGWVGNLLERMKPKVAAVALANMIARIAWALMARQDDYKPAAA